MPKVYDPRPGGRTMIRSRRRRKPTNARTLKAPTTSSHQNNKNAPLIGDDLLEFCNSIENSSPKSDKSESRHGNSPPFSPAMEQSPATSNTTTASSTTRNQTEPPIRTALAIDTRFLNAQEDTAFKMINDCKELLKCAMDRGIGPHVVSWTRETKSSCAKKTVRPRAQVVQVHSVCSYEKKFDFDPLLIQPSTTNNSNSNSDNASPNVFQVPKLLAANASWKLFGEFVESILQTDPNGNRTSLETITLLTNDVSFLADTRSKAHKAGLDTFWNRVKPHFLASHVQAIRIVVLLTDAVEVVDPKATPDAHSRGLAIAECINSINQHIRKKAEAEFQANRSYLQFDSSKHLPAIHISASTVDNSTVGLKMLLRTWSRERVQRPFRLTFDFPEALDSSQCSLALDAVYKSIPFRLDSKPAQALQKDLKLLSQATLQVEKLMSIASLDASLLYGVPIRVRPGLEGDIQSHNEMILLVQSLFHQLSQKECALVLSSQGPQTSTDEGLFHSNHHQTFVLMAEEIPKFLQGTTAPSTGLLFRVASSDHLLEEIGPGDFIPSNRADESSNHFSEYVEQALECLAYSDNSVGYNPLYADVIKARPILFRHTKVADHEESSTDVWNDNSGVGASIAATESGNGTGMEVHGVRNGTKWSNDEVGTESVRKASVSKAPFSPRTKTPYESELDEDGDTGSMQVKPNAIPRNTNRKNLARQIGSLSAAGEAGTDDVECTDDERSGLASLDNLSSDSDDSHSSVRDFEYS
eukprot:scaffold517_cov119-Cylindrotheca_fusiformis.AAC.26